MLRTRENSDVFNSLDEIYLVFTSKKQISSIYHTVQPTDWKTCINSVLAQKRGTFRNAHTEMQKNKMIFNLKIKNKKDKRFCIDCPSIVRKSGLKFAD